MSEYISWSETAFATQEERLAVATKDAQLHIGIPKEREMNEHRILLTPESVEVLVRNGHEIRLEQGAGSSAGFTDAMYAEAGASVVRGPQEVFECAVIAKVAPPTLSEIAMMRGGQTLISALQLRTRNRDYFKALADKKITALALEEVRNGDDQSALRIAMSEIAGQMAARLGASLLAEGASGAGKGKLIGGVPGVAPANVVVIGAGVSGTAAARAALGMGASVVLMDASVHRLRGVTEQLEYSISTEVLQDVVLSKRLNEADIVIGALAPVEGRTPVVVTEDMVGQMSAGSVVIDISIDHGGCFETSEITSHDAPTFVHDGVVHYCVPNIASAVGHTASIAMSNFVAPMLGEMAAGGGVQECLHFDLNIRAGLYLYRGLLTKRHLGEHFDLPFSNDSLLFGTL